MMNIVYMKVSGQMAFNIDGFNSEFSIKLFSRRLFEGFACIVNGNIPSPELNKLGPLLSKLFCDNNILFLSNSLLLADNISAIFFLYINLPVIVGLLILAKDSI